MYLNVNIIFIILSYQCFSTYAQARYRTRFGYNPRMHKHSTAAKIDCYFPMSIVDFNQPIIFTMNKTSSYPSVIHPNSKRFVYRSQYDYFNLACIGGNFKAPVYIADKNLSEVTVQCLNKTFVGFESNEFEFSDFICEKVPESKLKLTQERCQNINHRVVEIGFQTKNFFLKLYSTCFNLEKKNVLYSWYLVECPMYRYAQASKDRVNFTSSSLFEDVDPSAAYEQQSELLNKFVNSTYLSKSVIYKVGGTRFFSAGHLTPKNAFVYVSEKRATFYYENTAPQWYIFQETLWKNLDRVMKINLSQSRNKHVIVTGTYDVLTLPDEKGIEQPMYLGANNTMAIPLYIWKLCYDLVRKTGVVYIGLNNPYKIVQKDNYLCIPMVCPGGMLDKRFIDKRLLYCCTKDAFEITFGKIDLTVYRESEFFF